MTKTKKKTGAKNTAAAKDCQQVEMNIPALSEYVGVVRLAVSGIASRLDFSVEQVEDIKVAVTEACANAVQYAYGKDGQKQNINVLCKTYPDHLEINIKDKGKGFDVDSPPKPDKDDGHTHLGLGITFMKTLMDKVEIVSKKGQGTSVKLTKSLSPSKAA